MSTSSLGDVLVDAWKNQSTKPLPGAALRFADDLTAVLPSNEAHWTEIQIAFSDLATFVRSEFPL